MAPAWSVVKSPLRRFWAPTTCLCNCQRRARRRNAEHYLHPAYKNKRLPGPFKTLYSGRTWLQGNAALPGRLSILESVLSQGTSAGFTNPITNKSVVRCQERRFRSGDHFVLRKIVMRWYLPCRSTVIKQPTWQKIPLKLISCPETTGILYKPDNPGNRVDEPA